MSETAAQIHDLEEQIKRLQGAIREITPLLDERLGYSIIDAWIDEDVITAEDMEGTDD